MQLQLGASQQALLELQRLQAESQAKRQEVASLEASRDAQAAALAELARQRDEEATRRYFRRSQKSAYDHGRSRHAMLSEWACVAQPSIALLQRGPTAAGRS